MTRVPRSAVRAALAALAAGAVIAASAVAPAQAHGRHHPPRPPLPSSYLLSGDDGGSRFEGIGYDPRSTAFYVSEVTGGEIHRGFVANRQTTEWLAGDGTDGRYTARGVTVDRRGRVFVVGGPNAIDHPGAPDIWIYSRSGRLIAALATSVTGATGAYLNDVAIGPDGSAYVTDSNGVRVFRIRDTRKGWTVDLWKDAGADGGPAKAVVGGFNFNGIVATPDGRYLLVVQSATGQLWRLNLRTREVREVATGGADLTFGDGLVLSGRRLSVVRNQPRHLATLHLSRSWRSAVQVADVETDLDRILTTAKLAKGRLLAVDSKFDEQTPVGPYEVVVLPRP